MEIFGEVFPSSREPVWRCVLPRKMLLVEKIVPAFRIKALDHIEAQRFQPSFEIHVGRLNKDKVAL